MKKFRRSAQLFKQSQKFLAGGVSSMLRAASRPQPLFFKAASGSKLVDVDGNQYLDYTLAWGPLILGSSHPAVVRAVQQQLRRFQTLGAQHELEIQVAERIGHMVPCSQMLAFSNTGSEAVQLALRLARAATGRPKIVKFEGHYHGWMDNILFSYHPQPPFQPGPRPVLTTEGQLGSEAQEVIVLPWNNPQELEACLRERSNEIAAIITEPILCNSSCLMPLPGYLQTMRELATRYGVILIFDEVITGFRVAPGGAQSLFGIVPDLAIFGKAVASGFPLSVVAGKREILNLIAEKRVIHAGTFNGNPISLAAAQATLTVLNARGGAALRTIRKLGERLIKGIRGLAAEAEIPLLINGVGSAFHLSFTKRAEMLDYRDTLDADTQTRDVFLEAMLQEGIYLLSDGRWYVSAAHSAADVEFTLQAARKALAKVRDSRTAVSA
jgi:glutamate-1-semialdehyde 2,1-aminomutase